VNADQRKAQKKGKRKLTLNDFLMTSYGQTRREVLADYDHYVKTGEVR
jgi:hypothetical protein